MIGRRSQISRRERASIMIEPQLFFIKLYRHLTVRDYVLCRFYLWSSSGLTALAHIMRRTIYPRFASLYLHDAQVLATATES